MTANDLTPEHVSEVAEKIAASLPPDPAGGFAGTEFDPSRYPTLGLPDRSQGPPHIVEIWLVDQYGQKVASGQLQVPIVPTGGTVMIPGIQITC